MNEKNIFEVAIRNKYRFPFRGLVSVEDLWDLSVKDLDLVYKTLNSQIKQSKEEGLLETKSKEDEVLDTQIEIVKYIVKVKLDDEKSKLQAKANKEQKQKLMSILSEKQETELREKSAEEIYKMLEELDV